MLLLSTTLPSKIKFAAHACTFKMHENSGRMHFAVILLWDSNVLTVSKVGLSEQQAKAT